MIVIFGVLRSGSRRLSVGSCVLALCIGVAFLATPLGAERIANESTTELSTNGTRGPATTSLEWRLEKWQRLIHIWEARPILGRGLGTVTSEEAPTGHPTNSPLPHNEYLRYLVETGVLGLIILLGALASLILRLRRAKRTATSHGPTLALAVVAGLLANAAASNTLLYTPAAYAATLIVACALFASTGRLEQLHVNIDDPVNLNVGDQAACAG
jgi:O-antigen ligase